MAGFGEISGNVTIGGAGVARQVVAVSRKPVLIDGVSARIVVGETESAPDGSWSMVLPEWSDEVIIVALDDYGEVWQANTDYEVGDIIRPTVGNETGYVYQATVAGNSGPTEPTWWLSGTDQVGAATFEAVEQWWPETHAPITPIFNPDGGAEYEWQASDLSNGDFETGDLTDWTVAEGDPSVTTDPAHVVDGIYGLRGGSGFNLVQQSVTLPADARAFRLSAVCIYGTTNWDTGGVWVEFFDGASDRVGGTNLSASIEDRPGKYPEEVIALVPTGAVSCVVGAWLAVDSGGNDGGVDNISLDWLVGSELTLSAAGIINGGFESEDLTGWSEETGLWAVLESPDASVPGGWDVRPDGVSEGVLVQSFQLPGSETHVALTGYLGKAVSDRDNIHAALRFRDSQGAVIDVYKVWGPRSSIQYRPCDLLAQIPNGSDSVDIALIGRRIDGTAANARGDEFDLAYIDAPVAFTEALTGG